MMVEMYLFEMDSCHIDMTTLVDVNGTLKDVRYRDTILATHVVNCMLQNGSCFTFHHENDCTLQAYIWLLVSRRVFILMYLFFITPITSRKIWTTTSHTDHTQRHLWKAVHHSLGCNLVYCCVNEPWSIIDHQYDCWTLKVLTFC